MMDATMLLQMVLLVGVSRISAQMASLTADPQVVIPGLTQFVKLRCTLNPLIASGIGSLLVMQIEKTETGTATPLTTLVPGSTAIVEAASLSGRADVIQYYDENDVASTMLELTIYQPVADDDGTYMCAVSTLDKRHLLAKFEVTTNVTGKDVTTVSVTELTNVLIQVMSELNPLQKQVQTLTQEKENLEQRVAELENSTCAKCDNDSLGSSPSGQVVSGAHSCLSFTDEETKCFENIMDNFTMTFQDKISDFELKISGFENTINNQTCTCSPSSSPGQSSLTTSATVHSQTPTSNPTQSVTTSPATTATTTTSTSTPTTPWIPVITIRTIIMSPLQSIYLRDLPTDQAIVAPFEIPMPSDATNFLANVTMQVCLEMDPLSDAEKVTLESYKVSGSTFYEYFGICLGKASGAASAGIVGKRRSTRSSYTPCECDQGHSLYGQLPIHISHDHFTDVSTDLRVCLFSLWSKPVTRAHVYMDPKCTEVVVSAFTN